MKKYIKTCWKPLLLLLLLCGNVVSAVLMDPSVDYMASDWTLNSKSSIDVDYINISSSWINLGSYGNITFARNISSSRDLIELNGNYALGNYTTNLSVDVYAPSDWSAVVSMTPVTNNSENDVSFSLAGYSQVNTTHRRYYGTYNPSNTLSEADMGYFDVNVSVTASNSTLQYSGYNVSTDVFEVYKLNSVTGINSSYNNTYHSVNFSWGATEEAIYYFDNYNAGEAWTTDPANMVDGNINNYAQCFADPDVQLCTSNTCPGTNVGNITQVSVRARYSTTGGTNKALRLRPIWNGTDDMDTHSVTVNSNSPLWTSWIDITTDTNAPTTWNFTNIANLDMDVEGNTPDGGHVNCYQVELKIIYDTSIINSSTDSFVVVRNNNSYPSDPTDGYEVQNSTSTRYDIPLTFDSAYFMVYAYNDTTHSYAIGTEMPWGCLGVSVYNESAAHQGIGFDIEISDKDGDEAYKLTDQTNILYINFSNIPYGDDTIIVISNSSYRNRVYTYDLSLNNFYNYTFYLPPLTTPGSGGGSGDSNDSLLCVISVVDKTNQPIDAATIQIKRYINTTDEYETVGSSNTDGNGQISVWLVPNQLYLFNITKEGYTQTGSKHWIPNELLYTKTFMLEYVDTLPDTGIIEPTAITFTATMNNATQQLTITYDDEMLQTINTQVYIYELNTSDGSDDLFDTYTATGSNTFSYTINGNTSNGYLILLYLNHSHWGMQKHTKIVNPTNVRTITTQVATDSLFTLNFGYNPFGWSNTFMFIILLGAFFSFGQRGSGVSLILVGGIMLLINYVIGFNTAIAAAAGGIIPGLFIILGVLVLWRDSRKEQGGG